MTLTRASMRSRHDDKVAKARRLEQARRTAYRLVDIRDDYRCRACGKRGTEHHHILGRGRKESETSAAICLLCAACHDLRHTKRVLTIVGNADAVLLFELDGRTWHG